MMTQKKLRPGLARLHVNTERKLWKVKKGCASKHPTFQELEICPNLFVIALPTAFFGLQQRRLVGSSSLLQLSCITRTAMHLSFLCRLHLAQLNASLQQIIFHSLPLNFEKFFSLIFPTTSLYSLYQRERLRTQPCPCAVISVPDH